MSDLLKNRFFPGFTAMAACLLMAGLTYLAFEPRVGFDDANITQNYAENIALGKGYVYFETGERVEGSTSLLWTFINALAFRTVAEPEFLLFTFCLLSALVCILITQDLAQVIDQATAAALGQTPNPPGLIAGTVAVLFLLHPSFFIYQGWSLMDHALYTPFVLGLIALSMRMLVGDGTVSSVMRLALITLSGALYLVRPEGLLFSVYWCLVLGASAMLLGRRHLLGLIAQMFCFAVAIAAITTLARLSYFGQPLPNTFYAKVSTGLVSQAVDGAKYVLRYLLSYPVALSLIVLGWMTLLILSQRGKLPRRTPMPAWLGALWAALIGFWGLYALLGGDHFDKFRFFQPVDALLAAAIAGPLCTGLRRMRNATAGQRGFAPLVLSCVLLLAGTQYLAFYSTKIGMQMDFVLAERGRRVGEVMNSLPEDPTIAVVAAGGISRTFDGRILDLMGLNWTEMAHAVDDLSGTRRNHGGFDRALFYREEPEIVLPQELSCQHSGQWPEYFFRNVLKGLTEDVMFRDRYRRACWSGVTMFVRSDYLAEHQDVFERIW